MKIKLLTLIPCLLLCACSAVQEQAFLTDAPAVISGTLATATDLAGAYAAAQQSINGQKLSLTNGLSAAQTAAGSLASSNIANTVQSVFTAINALGSSITAANPNATSAQVAAAQSLAVTAAQVALQAAAPAGSTASTTAMFRIHFDPLSKKLIVTAEKPFAPTKA